MTRLSHSETISPAVLPHLQPSTASSTSSTSLVLSEAEARALGQLPGSYQLSPSGLDQVEFLLAAGPADPLQPLAAVASGGESARVMLALKAAPSVVLKQAAAAEGLWGADSGRPGAAGAPASSSSSSSSSEVPGVTQAASALAAAAAAAGAATQTQQEHPHSQQQPQQEAGAAGPGISSGSSSPPGRLPVGGGGAVAGPPVLVLDELDSGVGSRLGGAIGQLLQSMASPPAAAVNQVLCVTHLPQVGVALGGRVGGRVGDAAGQRERGKGSEAIETGSTGVETVHLAVSPPVCPAVGAWFVCLCNRHSQHAAARLLCN